jgi:Tfp pilus assembly protein PilV
MVKDILPPYKRRQRRKPVRFDLRFRLVVFLCIAVLGALGATLYLHNQADYAYSNVQSQLQAQQIVMPGGAAFTGLTQDDIKALSPYSGQTMTTGAQAEAYADHFIARHLAEMGMTYSRASTACRATPPNQQACALEPTIFQGTTLRSMLLEAWGFSELADRAALFSWFAGAGTVLLAILLVFEIYLAPDRRTGLKGF